MGARYVRGDTACLVAPVLTAQAVEVGDLTGLSGGNVVRASDETWVTDLATTQRNFVRKFLGVSGQRKAAGRARVDANGRDNRIRIDPEGVWAFDCNSTSFAVGDLVGPAKQVGNALENQKVVAVTDESLAIGRVVEATTSSTEVYVKVFSTLAPAARQLNVAFSGLGAGAAAGTNVTAAEAGDGVVRQTTLTLASTPVTVTDSGGAGGGWGSQKLYDFPEGRVLVLGVTANLTVTAGAGIGATAALSVALGTTATSDATIDSTDVNLLPANSSNLSSSAKTVTGALASSAQFDGTGTAIDAILNMGVPDAGITATATVTVTGTITITWTNLGDY